MGGVQVDQEVRADAARHRSSIALMNEHHRCEEGNDPKRYEYHFGAGLLWSPSARPIEIGHR
jgi:hypothetical protein